MKKRGSLYVIVSLTIAISMILSLSVFAQSTSKTTTASTVQEAEIVGENILSRGEYEKHFLMSDGTVLATTYPEPVHYLAGDEWIEIDNTLSGANGVYKNNNKAFSVAFSQKQNVMCISNGNYSLAWTHMLQETGLSKISISDTSTLSINNNPHVTDSMTVRERTALSTKAQSQITSVNAFGSNRPIDVQYAISQHKVAETIIFRQKTELTSVNFMVDSLGLTAVLNDYNGIDFLNDEGRVIFSIAAPIMRDGSGALLTDFDVDIRPLGGTSEITITPNAEWFSSSSRVYPISFEPMVTSSQYQTNYMDTYVHQGDAAGDHVSESILKVGLDGSSIHRAYVKLLNLPDIDETAQVFYAEFKAFFVSGTTSGGDFSIYRVAQAWDDDTISYANQPTSELLVSGAPCGIYEDNLEFEITTYIRRYYANQNVSNSRYAYHGFMLRYTDETHDDYNHIRSSESSNASYYPVLTVLYNPPTEVESNNTMANANEIGIANPNGHDSEIYGVLSSAADVDYYKLQPKRHGRVTISLSYPQGYDYSIMVYKLDGTEVSCSVSSVSTNSDNYSFKVTRGTKAAGTCETYYIKVKSNSSSVSSNQYCLTVFYSQVYEYNLNWAYPLSTEKTYISSPVGFRNSPIGYHMGIDLPGTTSDAIYSVCGGEVVIDDTNTSMGQYYTILSDDIDPYTGKQYVIRYMHLSSKVAGLDAGDRVEKGDYLGQMGTTGNSNGVHLHFEVNDEGITKSNTNVMSFINPVDIYEDTVDFYGYVYDNEK